MWLEPVKLGYTSPERLIQTRVRKKKLNVTSVSDNGSNPVIKHPTEEDSAKQYSYHIPKIMKKPAVNGTQCASALWDRCIVCSNSPGMQNPQNEWNSQSKIGQNSPNIIQRDPETKTNASMIFSLSQRFPVQERLELQHRLQQIAGNLGD